MNARGVPRSKRGKRERTENGEESLATNLTLAGMEERGLSRMTTMHIDCEACAAPLPMDRTPRRRFCNAACQARARRQRKDRPKCETCGAPVPMARRQFCSEKCGRDNENAAKRLQRVGGPGSGGHNRTYDLVPRQSCEVCGAAFYAAPSQIIKGGGKFCSVACRSAFMSRSPESFPQTRTRRGNGGRREDLGGLYVRSSWEANWARYLRWQQEQGVIISWEFEPITFEFPVKRGNRFYTPDFRVTEPDGDVFFYEIKGYMDPRSATKLARMARHHPKVRIELIEKDEYYEVARRIGPLIAGWERQGRASRGL